MKKLIIVSLSSLFAMGCSSVGSSVKGFGESIINILPGQEMQATFKVEDLDSISQEEEFWLGRAVAGHILSVYPPSTDLALNQYVAKVGLAVSKFSGRPETFGGYSFQLLESDEINALSAPGGYIFITTGLLRKLENEDELAAVLAHEIAHIQAKHGLAAIKKAEKSKGTMMGGEVVGALNCSQVTHVLSAAFEAAVDDIVNTLLIKGYSRDQEFEADKIAQQILKDSGYNTAGLGNALEELNTTQSGGGWFSTHPSPQDRLNELGSPGYTPFKVTPEAKENRFPKTS